MVEKHRIFIEIRSEFGVMTNYPVDGVSLQETADAEAPNWSHEPQAKRVVAWYPGHPNGETAEAEVHHD